MADRGILALLPSVLCTSPSSFPDLDMSISVTLPADASLMQLLQASVASESPEIAHLRLQRVFPIIICADVTAEDGAADVGSANRLADELLNDVKEELEGLDCELLGEFGPFDGSRQWSVFYRTKEPVDERTFKARVQAAVDAVKPKSRIAAKKTGNLVKIGVAVGKTAVIITGGAAVATTLNVPVVAWIVLMASGEAVTIVENTKKLFFG